MHEFARLVDEAHKRDCWVAVADGYPDGPARKRADLSAVVPVTDTQALADLCRENRVDAVVASFSDLLFECGTRAAHAAGLPSSCSLAGMELLRDKRSMKRMFDQLGIPHARSVTAPPDQVKDASSALRFPCVVKPIDAYGSYGVRVVENPDAAACAARQAAGESSRAGEVLVEEYDDGFEFNMISWVVDGRAQVVSIADREKTPCEECAVPNVTRNVYPSVFSAEVLPQAADFAQRIASCVGIEFGPLCLQFFWSPDRGIRVGEAVGRVFGYEHELLEYACGLSVEDLLLDTALDHDALRARLAGHNPLAMPRCSCVWYFHVRDGVVGSLDAARAALDVPEVQECVVYYREGDRVENGRGGKPYGANAFAVADTREQLDAATERAFFRFSIPDAQGGQLCFPNRIPACYGAARKEALR